MNLFKVILLLLTISFSAMAQNNDAALKEVTAQDLEQNAYPQDSTAVAAFLYQRGKTWFELKGNDWAMVTEIYTRIKIYKKEGYKYASPEIMVYSGDKKFNGIFSDAATYNLVNGQPEKTLLKKDSEFEEAFKENFIHKKITLPNVKEGSIIEYKYTVRSPFFTQFPDFMFQYDIPVQDIRYDISIPVYFNYNAYTTGFATINETPVVTIENPDTKINERHTSYFAKNIRAVKNEVFVNNISNYISILKHELESVRFPNSIRMPIASSWAMVARKIYTQAKFSEELAVTSYFENDIKPLIAGNLSQKEKTLIIFNYVKNHMNWNDKKGYFIDKGVKKAYKAKVGNVAEINLMLTAMLRYAYLDANPVLISTVENGIAAYPTPYAFNYIITAVKVAGKTVLLDATSKYTQPDILPIRALNWTGRLIKPTGETEEVNLMPQKNSTEIVSIIADVTSDGTVTGKARDQYLDYGAYVFREFFAESQNDNYIEKLEKRYKGITITDYKISNEKDVSKPLMEEYSFTNSMLAESLANKIYLNPMLFFAQEQNPFTQETREFPIDYIYPRQDRYMINIRIPQGYIIESIPTGKYYYAG